MSRKEQSRKVYQLKINNVVDYVDQHLEESPDLAVLASIAGLSPFHFHRIFSAMTGETVHGFVRRLRVEKAARMLLNRPEVSVTEVCYSCGFSSMPVFCRSFRDHFGVSALDFRDQKADEISKIRQLLSKKSQSDSELVADLCLVEPNEERRQFMKNNIEVKKMPAMKLVYVRHTGSFDRIGESYGKLMQWAGPRGLLQVPDVKTVTVYHDDPSVTAIEKVRQSACITVSGLMKTEGEVGFMEVPELQCAVGRFEIGVDGFTEAWNTMCLWLTESGFQPGEGCPYELYHNNHEEHPERKFILDICIPVKEL